jgi:hypothetical protein
VAPPFRGFKKRFLLVHVISDNLFRKSEGVESKQEEGEDRVLFLFSFF